MIDTSILGQYGLAGMCIAALAAALFYVYKELRKERDRNDAIQEKRVLDAKQTNDKLVGPMEENNRTNKQIYDLLQVINNRREQ